MDMRIEHIFREEMKDDTSFKESSGIFSFLSRKNYSAKEAREIWHQGIRRGIEIGLRRASIEGQRIDLVRNTQDARAKEYLTNFYQLCADYGYAIQYHPEVGLIVINTKPPDHGL